MLIGLITAGCTIVAAILGAIIERGKGSIGRKWILLLFLLVGLLVGLFIGGMVTYNLSSVAMDATPPTALSSDPSLEVVESAHVTRQIPLAATATILVAPSQTPDNATTVEATDIPAPTPPLSVASLEEALMDTPVVIPFGSADHPDELNPLFGWQPGGSSASNIDLSLVPGALTIIAGPRTKQWDTASSLPYITLPIEGDFDVRVKVDVAPTGGVQNAGLGVMSADSQTTWIRIGRVYYQKNQRITARVTQKGQNSAGETILYSNNLVYFEIHRRGSVFNVSYSANGTNWNTMLSNAVMEMPTKARIYLYVYSEGDTGLLANFSELTITRR